MRIVIDLQALQSQSSGTRGIGRYSRSLVEAILRNAPEDEIILLLNGMIGRSNSALRKEFMQARPDVEVRIWSAAPPASHLSDGDWRLAAEAIREAALEALEPDVVLVTSLFEGFDEDAVTTVSSLPTAVVLYDIIPHLYRDTYLTSPHIAEWYDGKIAELKRADLVLSISDWSAHDAITHLQLPPTRIANISSDAASLFAERPAVQSDREMLSTGLGLTRPFLLYTGGIDYRKNIHGLIRAFAALSGDIISSHQLAIVCRVDDAEKARLLQDARDAGLPEGALVVTGFVSDDTLVTLYNACKAFVFPSWYEGFGLPVLEAMRCGAPVIGSNVSSIPEVIGRADALFDPHSTEDMARLIESVLTDEDFRQSLRDFAPKQAARFDWDATAKRALAAMRSLAARARTEPQPMGKPRLAHISPLPPERSGISFYSAELLPHLAQYYDIEMIVAQEQVNFGADTGRFTMRGIDWFRANFQSYDRVLYQFGNSAFHAHMFDLIADIPGAVVLHDFFLSNIEAHMDPSTFTRVLAEDHGYRAVLDRFDGNDGLTQATLSYPANGRVLRAAEGVIVHSSHSRALARHFFGPANGEDWAEIPLLRVPVELADDARAQARMQLGLTEEALLICSFGNLSTNKLITRLIDGFMLSAAAKRPETYLVFVGDGGNFAETIMTQIAGSSVEGRVKVTGWTKDELYRTYLQAADFAVQLRINSRGESSAAVLDAQNYHLPVIVNAHGSLADLDPETVLHIPDAFSDAELAEAIDRLIEDEDLRVRIGAAARNKIVTEHSPPLCAQLYHDAIETYHRRHRAASHDLFERLTRLPADTARDKGLAQAIADTFPAMPRLRQLFVDVTVLAQKDANSGIQRVVRSVLSEWLRSPPEGWRVEPVFADPEIGRYRYARRFTCRFLEIPDHWAEDSPVDFMAGDRFVGLDLVPNTIPRMRPAFCMMAAAGVEISFVVYDLLPISLPQHFASSSQAFENWLSAIAASDKLICISRTVAEELRAHLKKYPPEDGRMPEIGWFHIGADIENAIPTKTMPADLEPRLREVSTRPSFLMVGTVEPRKGHAFVLTAFERLWAKGIDANLVIVGKTGWQVQNLCTRMRAHPESGRRLDWFENASDVLLKRLYQTCDCLIAASEGEGFGLPLIKASKHDLPILARDIPVFREVAGDHAAYFDGKDVEALVHAVEVWLNARRAGQVVSSGGMSCQTWRESAAALIRELGIVVCPC